MREDRPAGEPLHFATLWEAIADEIPSAPALTHGARTIAWGEFEQRAARLAGALLAHGLGPGSVVACYLYNCPEYFETFLAALKIRAVPANVNYRYGGAELRALLENCEAEALCLRLGAARSGGVDPPRGSRGSAARRGRRGCLRCLDARSLRLLRADRLVRAGAPGEPQRAGCLLVVHGRDHRPAQGRPVHDRPRRDQLAAGCARCSSAQAPTSGSWTTRPSRHATAIAWSPSRRRRSCTAPGSPSPRSPR